MLSGTSLLKIFGFSVVVATLILTGSVDPPTWISTRQCPAQNPQRFVEQHLTSVRNPKVVMVNPSEMLESAHAGSSFEVPTIHGDPYVQVSHLDMRHGRFEMNVQPSIPLRDPGGLQTYRGQLTEEDHPFDSLVALFFGVQDEGRPGFVSGFIVESVSHPERSWDFIEPARPLMMSIARRTSDGSLSRSDVRNCLGKGLPWHVIYQAKDVSKGFISQLEPARDVKAVIERLETPFNIWPGATFNVNAHIANHTDPGHDQGNNHHHLDVPDESPEPGHQVVTDVEFLVDGDPVATVTDLAVTRGDPEVVSFTYRFSSQQHATLTVRTEGNEMERDVNVTNKEDALDPPPAEFASIPFVAIADAEFYDFHQQMAQKTWWEGQAEVINLADAFFNSQIDDFRLLIRGLEAWREGASNGPGQAVIGALGTSEAINAYTLLCSFAQDVPEAVPNMHPNRPPGLTHLFTGRDLGPIPEPMAVSDAGGGFCESSCSQVGGNVVGLAEGVGGYKRASSTPPSCANAPLTHPQDLDPEAYHGLSQHMPHDTNSTECDEFGLCGRKNANSGYQASLYQRFILLAHELGHNLGANHSEDPTSIMYTPLQNTIRFKLDAYRQRNIREINECWKTCK